MKNIIMKNYVHARIFSLDQEVYIVGGYLRDALLGKRSGDIDYIVRGDIREFAAQLFLQKRGSAEVQNELDGASIIELKKEQMIRIALNNGMTLDFTELKGRLEDNLKERDFTMNALAWSPRAGIIDPCNGITDIKKHKIKAISIENFKNDPLRLLRVYRFVSELGWKADPKTRKMVKELNRTIKRPATERITLEFFKLLNAKNYAEALKTASNDGLLEQFLSISHKRLSENLKAIPHLESKIRGLPSKYKRTLDKPFSQELTYRGLLRLEQVLAGSIHGKNRLRLSRHILERLKVVYKLLPTIHYSLFTSSKMFDTFFKAKDAVFDILMLTGNMRLLKQAERFKKILKGSFLTADEIMSITNLGGGVELGKLIYRLKKMEFEGKIKTKKMALKWLKNL